MSRQRQPALADLVICDDPRIPVELPEPTRRALIHRRVRASRGDSAGSSERECDATIVIVTKNTLPAARLCLESVLEHTEDVEYEVRIVDSGSTDGTATYLQELSRGTPRVLPTFNTESHGLVASRNQALALARGRTVVLLSHDSVVPPGWLTRLMAHLGNQATSRFCVAVGARADID